jgi:4-carboxymuconolactone decarboxylase
MTTEKEQELERVTRQSGFRFGIHDFLAEVKPDALKARNDRWEAEHGSQSLLDRKTKELLRIVANVALRATVAHTQIHIHAAHKAGATPEEIMEALELVGRWAGRVAEHTGLEAWRATFRPDIPPIDRVVELR